MQSYHAQPIGLLTKHGKATWIQPPLQTLGFTVVSTDAFDTDTLGTFSGTVKRTLSALDCARRKAQLACELTGLRLGLGSEGSFGGGPYAGLIEWDQEILLLWDAQQQLEIVAVAEGPISLAADADRRAMACPPRQAYIAQAAEQLAQRLQSRCPACQAVNFWRTGREPGLPCVACGMPTQQTQAWLKACQHCAYLEREMVAASHAEPMHCQWCNP